MDELVTLARVASPRGEVVLRRRGRGDDAVDELIVNGTFAMDSSETSSERRLAQLVGTYGSEGRILVGGLGLGFTAAEILNAGVGRLVVVELEGALVGWAREGVTPTLARVATDPRVHLVVADVAVFLTGDHPDQPWDGIVLDVDNGPDFLIHEPNAGLYSSEVLTSAYDRLAPGGRLAIWCQGASPALLDTLRAIHPSARENVYQVTRGRRRFSYVIYTLDRPLAVG
ncbi:MAG: hypothetical protein ABWY56_04550 [Propionibacteriaceae bacterium]